MAQALAHGLRIELLQLLAEHVHDVESAAKRSGRSVAMTSRHLQILRRAGLVTARREGKRVFYSCSGKAVTRLLSQLTATATGFGGTASGTPPRPPA